ncbi:hypothetical protein [Bosea sp. Root381]|uniref:hypothetical protein n=1 Tax=Bosea sp. Root381 TaxID=1736524 RepID=UPI0012E3BF2A|nr:hypothetical protein [Bosea sp. Root381]
MISGKGRLVLRYARTISVEYQFGGAYDDTRSGYLLCDTSQVDPANFCDRLTLLCDDGVEIIVAVTNVGDRHLAVVGRLRPAQDAAA